jgi:putative transcriptional regulator
MTPSPSPVTIKQAREAAGQTQAEAAKLVHADLRSWQRWEAGERKMHPAFWDLYQVKTQPHGVKP